MMSLLNRYTLIPGRLLAMVMSLLAVNGCSRVQLEDSAQSSPVFDPLVFFSGHTRAWGIVQDWRGRVVRQFQVDMQGRVVGDELVLDERFVYADGERDTRQWRIERAGHGRFSGRAGDIVGAASGEAAGNALRWNYQMDLTVDGSSYRVNFDDWMWQLDGEALVNRSYIRKFGITVAEVTLFMLKMDAPPAD
jgi:hypothetical protein